MMLKNKVAVIYGARGTVGRVVARAFASEGAKLLLWFLLAIISWNCSHETLHDRRGLPTLAELASVAVCMASDRASAMIGTVVNLIDARQPGPRATTPYAGI
jgi:hypothetical protein